jgi:UDP:flavonoid glycosyltransferase YjiC (YdhE family)
MLFSTVFGETNNAAATSLFERPAATSSAVLRSRADSASPIPVDRRMAADGRTPTRRSSRAASDARRWASPAAASAMTRSSCATLVSVSSTWMDQGPLLQRIADALGRLPVRGVVPTGPAVDSAAIATPENVTVVRAAPHREVLRHAAATVTHAGHGTVAKSLAAGVPLVCMPLGRDQPDVAARVVRAGAGLRLDPRAAAAQIADAVSRLIREPRYADAARAAGAAISGERRSDRAVAELEALPSGR